MLTQAAKPYDAVVGQIADHHTELNLYSLNFVVTMNQQVYDSLSDDLTAIIDQHSGAGWSQNMAQVFDELDHVSRQEAEAAGHQVTRYSGELHQAWQPVLDRVTEN